MNQILGPNTPITKKKNKKFTMLKFSFSIFSVLTLVFFLLFVIYILNINYKEKKALELSKRFSLFSLYSTNDNYSVAKISIEEQKNPFVIGIIKIDKLKIDYPILSDATDEYLSISPCRFAGPMPNEVGNLCIAGHNYIDNTFFAKITNLIKDDEITIYDLSGNKQSYFVTEKKEVESTNLDCTSQETNGQKWITLVTCNSLKGTRHIIRATTRK